MAPVRRFVSQPAGHLAGVPASSRVRRRGLIRRSLVLACALVATVLVACGPGLEEPSAQTECTIAPGLCVTPGSGGNQGKNQQGSDPCVNLVINENPPQVCSKASGASATLTLVNACPKTTLLLSWINLQCGETSYATVPPGGSYVQPSFVGHPWRIRNAATQALMREIPALGQGQTTVQVP